MTGAPASGAAVQGALAAESPVGRATAQRRPTVPAQIVTGVAFVVAALAIVALRDDANRMWLVEAARRTWTSLLETAAAFVLFLVVFGLGIGLMALAYKLLAERKGRLATAVCGFLVLVLIVNALPILVYVEGLKGFGIHPLAVRVLALLTANAMLYYFFSGFIFNLWRETKKLYVISAPFKGSHALDYLRERAAWALLSSLGPLFYYLFSFTLFTDLLLQGYGGTASDDVGIVLSMFILLINDWSATGLWRFTVYLLIMMAMVLPIRFLLDHGLTVWERKRRMTHQVA